MHILNRSIGYWKMNVLGVMNFKVMEKHIKQSVNSLDVTTRNVYIQAYDI